MDRTFRAAYVLELMCNQSDHIGTFRGRSFKTTTHQAARSGWKIHLETKTATCPECSRKFKVEIKRKRVAV